MSQKNKAGRLSGECIPRQQQQRLPKQLANKYN